MTFNSFINSAKTSVKHFAADETGATAIEYGLIAGLVAVAIIAALTAMSGSLSDLFTNIGTKLSGAATKAST